MLDKIAILLVALLLDALGDPPNRLHPVAWMGSAIDALRRRAPANHSSRQLVAGGLIACGGMSVAAGIGWLLARLIANLPRPLNWLIGGLIVKMTFSLRGLADAADEVYRALASGNLEQARRLVSWHLVSRDTSMLNEAQLAAATIESVAENTSDGIIAPLLYFIIVGLPGALAYRFANTADAMLGYRDTAREWLGKIPARLDDVLNLLPARLTALLLMAAAALTGEDVRMTLAVWQRDWNKTASPNAGHPMSAAAGALGIELAKNGQYVLGAGGRAPTAGDIGRSVRLMKTATLLGTGLVVIGTLFWCRKSRPASVQIQPSLKDCS
ncbi:MAG: cobalamin biosynthesis protein [Anaerolineae bacterium]|nr:cobalamin biosynthesis protein [Anaerolineae bacterium]